MPDVHVHNDAPQTSGSTAWVWALVVLVLVGVIAWLVLDRGEGSGLPDKIDVNIEVPATGNPN
jgi:hypothetical protein